MTRRANGDARPYQVHARDCPRPVHSRTGKSLCKCQWRAALVVGWRTSKSGKKTAIRKTRMAATESGATAKLRELQVQVATQTLPTRGPATVEQWLNHWHRVELPRSKPAPSTVITYRGVLDNYLIPLLGHVKLDRLTAEDILAAYDILADTGNPTIESPRPLSPSTIHHAHTVLVRSLRIAVQRKKIASNPAGPDHMDAPPRAEQEIAPLTTEEWRKVLAAAEGTTNAARWTVALALGLRQGEALGLRWHDVDLDAGTLAVARALKRITGRGLLFGPTKTKKTRIVPLPPSLAAELRAHRTEQNAARLRAGDQWHDDGLLFPTEAGTPTDPRTDHARWTRLLESAGVKHYRLHDARHSAATMLLVQGVELRMAMEILGHADVKTTMRYQHIAEETMAAAGERIDRALG